MKRIRPLAFHGACLALLALMVTKLTSEIFAPDVAVRLGHNSEAVLIVLLVTVTIQYVRPAAQLAARPWLVMGGMALACFAAAAALAAAKGDIDSATATLTEAFTASGLIALYLLLPRPVRSAPYLALAILVLIVVLNHTPFVTLQSEGLVSAMLAPIALDVADPRIVDPTADDRPMARLTWLGALLAAPIAFAFLKSLHLPGALGEAAHYGGHATEAFIAILGIHLYFWLTAARDTAAAQPVSARELEPAAAVAR
jgi:protein-S-isoprenylcysteine O-methyltransferase Ste14